MSGPSSRAGTVQKPSGLVRDTPAPLIGGRLEGRDPVRSIAHILRAAFIVLGVGALLWVLSSAFVTLFLAVLLAVLLRGLGRVLHRYTGLPITGSVLTVFLILVVAMCALGYWAGPRFATEGQQLWDQVSGGIGNLSNMFGLHTGLHAGLPGHGGEGGAGGAAEMISGHGSMIAGLVRTVATSTIGLLAAILVIVATGVYLAVAPDMYINGVSHLTPVWYQQRTRSIMVEMGLAMQGWMLGQLIDMVVVGIVVAVGLSLVGTPLAGVLAVVAGVCTFIPYFGTIISAIPAIIVALTLGVSEMVWVVGVFVIAHCVEGYLVAPFVQRRTVHLPPALTLISFVLLVAIFDIFGVLIATPLMACLMVGVARIYVEDILGDPAGRNLTVHARWYWFTPPASHPDETALRDRPG